MIPSYFTPTLRLHWQKARRTPAPPKRRPRQADAQNRPAATMATMAHRRAIRAALASMASKRSHRFPWLAACLDPRQDLHSPARRALSLLALLAMLAAGSTSLHHGGT